MAAVKEGGLDNGVKPEKQLLIQLLHGTFNWCLNDKITETKTVTHYSVIIISSLGIRPSSQPSHLPMRSDTITISAFNRPNFN